MDASQPLAHRRPTGLCEACLACPSQLVDIAVEHLLCHLASVVSAAAIRGELGTSARPHSSRSCSPTSPSSSSAHTSGRRRRATSLAPDANDPPMAGRLRKSGRPKNVDPQASHRDRSSRRQAPPEGIEPSLWYEPVARGRVSSPSGLASCALQSSREERDAALRNSTRRHRGRRCNPDGHAVRSIWELALDRIGQGAPCDHCRSGRRRAKFRHYDLSGRLTCVLITTAKRMRSRSN